jgi:hypothetical protein
VIKHKRLVVVLGVVCVCFAAPVLLYFARSPVLIVTDASFVLLHGDTNLRWQKLSASLTLFRQVKPVMVADGASPDMVSLAITEVSARPFCVLFPRSQTDAARHFHDKVPEIPAVLVSGLLPVSNLPPLDGFFCQYTTDRETDLYRAGLFAGILGGQKETDNQEESAGKAPEKVPEKAPVKTYVLRQDRLVQSKERDLFTQGLKEQEPEAVIVFANSTGQVPDLKEVRVLVLTGVGGDILEKHPQIPVILFSWLNPALTAQEVNIQFDDSTWALAVPAVRMAAKGEAEGKIPSKPLIFPRRISDRNILRLLEKSAKKTP